VDAAVEHARQEWEESARRLESEARDAAAYDRLLDQVEAVTAALRRRVGETFTLADLAREYATAERWSRDAVQETSPPPGWTRTLALVEGAAFHGYARGAVDYVP
jgi:glutathione S-transferase